ncbi:DNA polymerase Y family protein [Pseudonocardia sp. KRD-176]|nr:DNA polymerase Y family protein [Pseudonocardia oceani]
MSGAPMRVLALWSPDWPVTAAARAEGVAPHRPAAVVVANRVLACSAVARAHGVRRGLRRREAQARCPDLVVLARDADRDARAFEPVVVAVEELAPGVEIVRPGLLALPAQGPVGWFGGEQAAAERLVDQVAARTGVECQVGVADGLFAAVLAARRGLAVGAGDTPAFLAPLGVEELDREPDAGRTDLVDLLRRLGLRSLGSFGKLDPEDVASRFGADAVLAHRLARGLDPRPPLRRRPPEELAVEIELDPPVDRVDAAAFAARGLAERLHAALAGHGLSCTRLGIAARTVPAGGEAGRELHRIWRCAEPLTPAGTVDRVRWQLDAWLARGGAGAVGWLRLTPEETVTAGALQLGLWGEVGEADARAGRAMVRVQALLGPDAVVTAVLTGGRDPGEQVRLVPWGDEREPRTTGTRRPARRPRPEATEPEPVPVVERDPGAWSWGADGGPHRAPAGWPDDVLRATGRVSAAGRAGAGNPRPTNARRRAITRSAPMGRPAVSEPPPSWPGRVPAPSPATVPAPPLPAAPVDAAGTPVGLAEPDRLTAAPHRVAVDGGPAREVLGWAGPWPLEQRWWTGAEPVSRMQVALDDGTALLLAHRGGRWSVVGVYD